MQALSDAHHPAPVRERPVCAAPTTPPARADDTTSAQRVHPANVRSACTQHSVVSTALPQTATPRPAVTGTVGESSLSGVESKEYIRGVTRGYDSQRGSAHVGVGAP